jgi:hypothetical protein
LQAQKASLHYEQNNQLFKNPSALSPILLCVRRERVEI